MRKTLRTAAAVATTLLLLPAGMSAAQASGGLGVALSGGGGSVTGPVNVYATVSGPDDVLQWCLRVDGRVWPSNAATGGDLAAGNSEYADSNTVGCWNLSDPDSNDTKSLNTGTLRFDTTAWDNGPHTVTLTVRDSSGRTATSTTTLATNNPGPTVSWTPPAGAGTGVVTLKAQADAHQPGTATIITWCLRVDGSVWPTNAATGGDLSAGNSEYDNSNTVGCWNLSNPDSSNTKSLNTGTMQFDTTAWDDGPHTVKLTVTDTSGRTATSTLSLTTSNPGPTVSWTPPSGTVTGVVNLMAQAAAHQSGSATITQWCLRVDGAVWPINAAKGGDLTASNSDYDNSNTVGCWNLLGRWWSNIQTLNTGTLQFDTTAWDDGPHTFTLTVADSSGRKASSTLTLTTNNDRPKWSAAWQGAPLLPGGVVTGPALVSVRVSQSGGDLSRTIAVDETRGAVAIWNASSGVLSVWCGGGISPGGRKCSQNGSVTLVVTYSQAGNSYSSRFTFGVSGTQWPAMSASPVSPSSMKVSSASAQATLKWRIVGPPGLVGGRDVSVGASDTSAQPLWATSRPDGTFDVTVPVSNWSSRTFCASFPWAPDDVQAGSCISVALAYGNLDIAKWSSGKGTTTVRAVANDPAYLSVVGSGGSPRSCGLVLETKRGKSWVLVKRTSPEVSSESALTVTYVGKMAKGSQVRARLIPCKVVVTNTYYKVTGYTYGEKVLHCEPSPWGGSDCTWVTPKTPIYKRVTTSTTLTAKQRISATLKT